MPDMPRCPSCQSFDVLVMSGNRRRCWACGHGWSARIQRVKRNRARREQKRDGTG